MHSDSPAFWTEREWVESCPPWPRVLDKPEPGYFRLRLVSKGPWVPARIWTYRPRPAGTDHFQAHINGKGAEVDDVWLRGRPIDKAHYDKLMAAPAADPMQPVSRRKMKETVDE